MWFVAKNVTQCAVIHQITQSAVQIPYKVGRARVTLVASREAECVAAQRIRFELKVAAAWVPSECRVVVSRLRADRPCAIVRCGRKRTKCR